MLIFKLLFVVLQKFKPYHTYVKSNNIYFSSY